MLHVIINGTRYNLAQEHLQAFPVRDLVQAAQAAMLAAGVTSAPVLDSDGEETGDTLPDEIEPKAWAFAEALDCSILSNIGYDGRGAGPDVWTSDDEPGEYLVLTESEREQAADEALESYIDECIIGQAKAESDDNAALASLVRTLSDNFDRDSWKKNALDCDGYGHTLSSYDGDEHEACIDGEWFYVYRVN